MSQYDDRPWLALYDEGVPADLETPFPDCLAMIAECGLQRGDRVVVQLQNVPAFLLAMLAIWRVGAIMVPVNPMYKQRELEGLLTDSGARVLIEQESLYPEAGRPAAESSGVTSVITTSELDLVADPGSVPLLAGSRRERPEG